jgi:hypothetical protein
VVSADQSSSVTGNLAAVAALVTPLIAALGALAVTGTVGRVQRNEPVMISLALFLVVGAGALWLIASQISTFARTVRIAASVAALAGFVIGFYAAVSTANDQPRPQIDASLSDDARKLTAEVTASNMETEDRLAVFVDVFIRSQADVLEPVYSAYEGPDADGNIKLHLSTILPKGPYTDVSIQAFTGESAICNEALEEEASEESSEAAVEKLGLGTGCVVLPIIPK